MGGFLHLSDLNPANLGKKHKNQIRGFEAPRNSLESPAESLQSYYTAGESQLQSHEGSRSMSKSSSYSTDLSMKKLVNDGISTESNSKHYSPSIVARLMGMDVFPSDTDSFIHDSEQDYTEGNSEGSTQPTEKASNGRSRRKLKYFRDKDLSIFRKQAYMRLWTSRSKFGKPHSRVHPQEKELQQFKKDFEAWQATRFLECARVVELGNIPEQWLAQLGLTKEKMAFYENKRKRALEKVALDDKTSVGEDLQGDRSKKDPTYKRSSSYSFRKKSLSGELDELSITDFDQKSDKSSAPSRIVILKHGHESCSPNDESWVSSSGSVVGSDCIKDLLEEVKEKLRCELHGKVYKRGSGIETPFSERPSPRHRERDHTSPFGENTTGDIGRKLLRSESSILYRSEIHPIGMDSPESISQETKYILSEQLRNLLDGGNCSPRSTTFDDTRERLEQANCSPRSTTFDDTRERLEQAKSILNSRDGWNCWNDGSYGTDSQSRSFRHEFGHEEKFLDGLSPRNLVRSLSAPLSGMSFGKVLHEDRHMLNGVHTRRKHDGHESVAMDGKTRKKEKFNIRERVSSIRNNLTLKRKLFNRKFQSVDLSQSSDFHLMKDAAGGAMMNLNDRTENYTEVPPSPASVCSSALEDFWKPSDHPSPISTSDITSVGDHSVGNVFREISSNLSELRRQLNQLDYEGSEVTTLTDDPIDAEVLYLEDESEAYIRDLLVASGLYDGAAADHFTKTVGDWVFEKVEDSYKHHNAEKDEFYDEIASHHKMLFDLLNEALSSVLKPRTNLSRYSRSVTGVPILPSLKGRNLLDKVWEIIREQMYPSSDAAFNSLDDLLSDDLDFKPWFSVVDLEEMKAVSREVEGRIARELIEETVMEFCSLRR